MPRSGVSWLGVHRAKFGQKSGDLVRASFHSNDENDGGHITGSMVPRISFLEIQIDGKLKQDILI